MLDALLVPGLTCWTTMPAGGYELRPTAAARLARLGYRPGMPDVLLWWRTRPAPAGVPGAGAIELKTTAGRLTKTRVVRTGRGDVRVVAGQVETHARLRGAGVEVAVCRSVDGVLAALREWGVPMRGAP